MSFAVQDTTYCSKRLILTKHCWWESSVCSNRNAPSPDDYEAGISDCRRVTVSVPDC
mgnify:CR=1 FL=1